MEERVIVDTDLDFQLKQHSIYQIIVTGLIAHTCGPDQSVWDADSKRASVEQRHVFSPGPARCADVPCQDPRYRLRCSERLRIELRPVPPCVRAGGRR
jgi:hypothetical protein